jgi:hypothetical protein
MPSNQQKKDMEQRALAAARKSGAPIPTGEVAGEEPDFRFHTPVGVLGIEICEVYAQRNDSDYVRVQRKTGTKYLSMKVCQKNVSQRRNKHFCLKRCENAIPLLLACIRK